MSIFIDKEFESLIPPLSADEFKQLEENCVRDGIRDPLVLWRVPNGDDILIDGHNRWKIAAHHAGMPFETVHMEFDSRDQVKAWIYRNQLGRRNLDKWTRFDMVKALEPLMKADAEKKRMSNLKNSSVEVPNSAHREQGKTRDKMAELVGVGHDTYRMMKAIDEKATPGVKKLVRNGEMSINQAYNSTFPKREDPVKAAKREHLEYELSKGDIVDIKAARKDRVNQEIISGAMVQEVMKLLNTIQKFSLYYNAKDLSVLRTELDDANKTHMKGIIKNCHMTLDGITRAIDGGKHGKI